MPTTLESLPRELRQRIFALALDGAAAQDHRFNDLVRSSIRRHDGMMRLEYNFIPTWTAVLGKRCSEWSMIHAPHILELATNLFATYPDLADNTTYVLERSLKDFEEEQVETREDIGKLIEPQAVKR